MRSSMWVYILLETFALENDLPIFECKRLDVNIKRIVRTFYFNKLLVADYSIISIKSEIETSYIFCYLFFLLFFLFFSFHSKCLLCNTKNKMIIIVQITR